MCPIWNAPVLVKMADQHKHTSLPTDGESEQNIVASFTHKGDYIYMGIAKGRIIIIKYDNLQIYKLVGYRKQYLNKLKFVPQVAHNRDTYATSNTKSICTTRILSHLCHKWLMTQRHNVTTLI